METVNSNPLLFHLPTCIPDGVPNGATHTHEYLANGFHAHTGKALFGVEVLLHSCCQRRGEFF